MEVKHDFQNKTKGAPKPGGPEREGPVEGKEYVRLREQGEEGLASAVHLGSEGHHGQERAHRDGGVFRSVGGIEPESQTTLRNIKAEWQVARESEGHVVKGAFVGHCFLQPRH